jgi:hypothetical protein
MTEPRIKHLEFIQANIARMSNHSSTARNWGITVAAGLLAVNATRPSCAIVWALPLVVIVFAFLDHFYLRTERKFRSLYNKVRLEPDDAPVTFELSTKGVPAEPPSRQACAVYWLLWGGILLLGVTIALAT